MKLSILTATAEIAESESALMELFLSSKRDMEVRDNQMLLLCGYRYTQLKADICHNQLDLFRTVDKPPVSFCQLVKNIRFMLEEKMKSPQWRTRGRKPIKFQRKECSLWVTKNDHQEGHEPDMEGAFRKAQSLWIVSNIGDQMTITQDICENGENADDDEVSTNDHNHNSESDQEAKDGDTRNQDTEEAPEGQLVINSGSTNKKSVSADKLSFSRRGTSHPSISNSSKSHRSHFERPRKNNRVGVRHKPSSDRDSELICCDEVKSIITRVVSQPINDSVSSWMENFNEMEKDSKELDDDGYHTSYKGIPHACRRFKHITPQKRSDYCPNTFVRKFKEMFQGKLYFSEDSEEAQDSTSSERTMVTVKVLPLKDVDTSIQSNPFVLHVANPSGDKFRRNFFDVADDPTLRWIKGRGGGSLTYIWCATTEPCVDKNVHLVPKFPSCRNYGGRE
jgi:hypothetical protein